MASVLMKGVSLALHQRLYQRFGFSDAPARQEVTAEIKSLGHIKMLRVCIARAVGDAGVRVGVEGGDPFVSLVARMRRRLVSKKAGVAENIIDGPHTPLGATQAASAAEGERPSGFASAQEQQRQVLS
eukprot:scaffold139_cov246-Pinguiococcus_pyrenoidosus.AAC.13